MKEYTLNINKQANSLRKRMNINVSFIDFQATNKELFAEFATVLADLSNSELVDKLPLFIQRDIHSILADIEVPIREKNIIDMSSLLELVDRLLFLYRQVNSSASAKSITDFRVYLNGVKNDIESDVSFIKEKIQAASVDYSALQKTNLVTKLEGLEKSNRFKMIVWLLMCGAIIVSGFLYVVSPLWDRILKLAQSENGTIISILVSAPKLALFIFLVYICLSFYKKYDSLAGFYQHKIAVASSVQMYSDYLFSSVARLHTSEQDEIKKEIIRFEIKSLDDLFKVPESKDVKSQMNLNVDKTGFGVSMTE